MVASETVDESFVNTLSKNFLWDVAPWLTCDHFPPGGLIFLEQLEIDPVLIGLFRVFINEVITIYFIMLS
jgi:hypothetical protein